MSQMASHAWLMSSPTISHHPCTHLTLKITAKQNITPCRNVSKSSSTIFTTLRVPYNLKVSPISHKEILFYYPLVTSSVSQGLLLLVPDTFVSVQLKIISRWKLQVLILLLYLHTTLLCVLLNNNCFFASNCIPVSEIKHGNKSNNDSNTDAHNPEDSKKCLKRRHSLQ